ncbi:hypothetical protein QF030_003774 [Streptomyces rishiriensis]|uniref:Uncharacterized protein n=1 Tax=Streptomyces rishiriensis TaxID=68264 RepID=A0ABU0NR41_STRRH|nr:hypothetical protein [Streptomyces rishiriensis]
MVDSQRRFPSPARAACARAHMCFGYIGHEAMSSGPNYFVTLPNS